MASNVKESKFQKKLISKLQEEFPGSIILKNDANYIQGIPDLTIFYENHWAALECKKSSEANVQPNQEYYISKMNEMSYAAFIYPENEETVINELRKALRA